MEEQKIDLSDEYLVQRAQEIVKKAVNWRDLKQTNDWQRYANLYDGVFEEKEKKRSDVLLGQSRMFINKIYPHVQRTLVDVLDTIFSNPDEIVTLESKRMPSEQRELISTVLNYRLTGHPINFYFEAYEACLDALKTQYGIFKIYPSLKTRKIEGTQEAIYIDENGIEQIQFATPERIEITEYHPNIDCVPYEDVFFDPRATWKDYWKYPIVHRMTRSKDYLKRRGYKNFEEIPHVSGVSYDETTSQQSDSTESSKAMENIIIFEVWDFQDVNNDGLLESCSSVYGGSNGTKPLTLIGDIEINSLPYTFPNDDYNRSPFIIGCGFPEPHKLAGKCIPQIGEGLQKETNALRNQAREAVAQALRPFLLVNKSAGLDLISLSNRRVGGIALGDDVSTNSIRWESVPDVTQGALLAQQQTDKDFHETVSPPNLLGVPSGGDETATAVSRHEYNANKKINFIIMNLANTLFLPAFKYLLKLEQEYESDKYIQFITGQVLGWGLPADGQPTKDVIKGDFDLKVNISVNKKLRLNSYALLMDRANQSNLAMLQMVSAGTVSPQDAKFFNVAMLYKKILELMGEKPSEEYIMQALPPMIPPQGGVASQPRIPADVGAEILSQNPTGGM